MMNRYSTISHSKTFLRRLSALVVMLLMVVQFTGVGFADSPTDQIHNYTITVKVNDDGTLDMKYHLEWEVLESDGIGPVEWVEVGLANSHIEDLMPLSENITDISYSGGYAVIYFDQAYYEGETIEFDFELTQDYMYEMNQLTEGETVYWFTPGWFDEIDVDELVIKWSTDKATSWSSGALIKGDYLTWTQPLPMGEQAEVSVTYPNDAFNFDDTKYREYGDSPDDWDGGWNDWDEGWSVGSDNGFHSHELFGFATVAVTVWFGVIIAIISKAANSYNEGRGMNGGTRKVTKKVVKRTLVEYHETCPGCGAPRREGQTECEFCGRSYVKSEEVIEEADIPEEKRKQYSREGEFSYGSDPNRYIRVHITPVVVNVPISNSRHGGHGGGSHHGGGHSCACACASCACACACACAGGGRAGCSTKDFYNTKLKASQFKPKKH